MAYSWYVLQMTHAGGSQALTWSWSVKLKKISRTSGIQGSTKVPNSPVNPRIWAAQVKGTFIRLILYLGVNKSILSACGWQMRFDSHPSILRQICLPCRETRSNVTRLSRRNAKILFRNSFITRSCNKDSLPTVFLGSTPTAVTALTGVAV